MPQSQRQAAEGPQLSEGKSGQSASTTGEGAQGVQARLPMPLARVGMGWPRSCQADLDLELHLLLDADHLFRAAHLPDTLVARLYHLAEGGLVRPVCRDDAVMSSSWLTGLRLAGTLSLPHSGTK